MRHLRPVLALGLLFSLACMHPSASQHARTDRKLDRLEGKVDRVLAEQAVSQESLDELLRIARRQGSGELTLFFPWNSARLRPGSDQHDRYVRFLDRVAFEAHGREVVLVAIGSAGDWKKDDWNDTLADRRASVVRLPAKRHLLHVPHRWLRVDGAGSTLAPGEAKGRTWRHVRVLAVYDEGDLPPLPPG
jgi:hypothetical protein